MRLLQQKEISRRGRRWSPHSSHRLFWFPTGTPTQTPVITTLHGRLYHLELQDVYAEFPEIPLVSISEAQRRPLRHATWLSTIYNGIDLRHVAIARAVGMPLRIAAKLDPVDEEVFHQKIQPLLRDPLVEFVGEIGEAQKDKFLGNACAYLFPINWPELFGIMMIEAMACATPVIAMSHGVNSRGSWSMGAQSSSADLWEK